MKQFVPFLILLTSFQLWGQQTVKWSAAYNGDSNQIELIAHIKKGWHIYSQNQNEDTGPVATSFEIIYGDTVVRSVEEPAPIVKKDPNFGGEVMYLENTPKFTTQLPEAFSGKVTIQVVFMSCNDEGCLPPELKELELIIKEDE